MGRTFGFVGTLVVVGIGAYIFMGQTQSLKTTGGSPATTNDVIGVRNDLMAMANAERRYFASNAKYASLDELRTNGDIYIPTRSDYTYSAEASEASFRILATYSGADPQAPKRISVDETMSLTQK